MTTIIFDLTKTQPSTEGKRHGGGKYGEIVLEHIINRGLPVKCYYDSKKWLNPYIKCLLDDNGIILYDINQFSLSEIISKNKNDIIFVPAAFDGNYWRKIDAHVIGVIHGLRGLESFFDMSFFMYKQSLSAYIKEIAKFVFVKLRRRKQKSFILSSLNAKNITVITVSHHSANSFKSFFPELNPSIPVFYSPSTTFLNTTTKKYSEKYFLLVAANRPVKNNLRAIIALDRLFSNGLIDKYRVKVTGIKDDSSFWYKIKNRAHFDFVGYVDEEELDQLYHDAYCFIYPTLNEGFGYPPLEAMHYGVPVMTTAITAVPEVCGGNVIYFNPLSIEEIMNRILMIVNEDVHDTFSKKSLERYEMISKKQKEDLDNLVNYLYNVKFE